MLWSDKNFKLVNTCACSFPALLDGTLPLKRRCCLFCWIFCSIVICSTEDVVNQRKQVGRLVGGPGKESSAACWRNLTCERAMSTKSVADMAIWSKCIQVVCVCLHLKLQTAWSKGIHHLMCSITHLVRRKLQQARHDGNYWCKPSVMRVDKRDLVETSPIRSRVRI